MTEKHKKVIREILMNDYDIRPSLASLIVKVFIESAEKVIDEDKAEKEQNYIRRYKDGKTDVLDKIRAEIKKQKPQ